MPAGGEAGRDGGSLPEERARRALDVALASAALIVLTPALLALAAAIKLWDRGPVFHRGERVGLGGRPFRVYKFRTMVPGAEGMGPGVTGAGDPRVTALGRWLRRLKADELPQLLNVLRGEMALVGPRPEDPRYVARYSPQERRLLEVRPGITSPATLAYRREEEMLTGPDRERAYLDRVLPDKLAIELAYHERRTIWTDLGVLLRTLAGLVRR